MLILRDDQMWAAYAKVVEAVLSAGSIAYLYMCMVLVSTQQENFTWIASGKITGIVWTIRSFS